MSESALTDRTRIAEDLEEIDGLLSAAVCLIRKFDAELHPIEWVIRAAQDKAEAAHDKLTSNKAGA
jgi:hypothetical protein